MPRLFVFVFALLLFTAARPYGSAASAEASLVANGDFETAQDADKPAGWKLPLGATWEKEGENHFLRLKSPQPGANVMLYQAVKLTPETRALELKFKVRYVGIKRGKESWFDGRIMLNFKDANGNVCQPSPRPPSFNGTSVEWKEHAQQFKVPSEAVTLERGGTHCGAAQTQAQSGAAAGR